MMRTTNRQPTALLTLTCVILLSACVHDASENDGTTDFIAADQETLEFSSFTRDPSISKLILFSEAGFWGTQLVRSVTPGALEKLDFVDTTQFSSANMLNRASSGRLTCGNRSTTAILFDGNLGFNGNTVLVSCEPNESVTFTLTTLTGSPGNVNFNDRTRSALILVNAENAVAIGNFSFQIQDQWNAALPTLLSAEATASAPVSVFWRRQNWFLIQQFLVLDSPGLPPYDAWFSYSVLLSLNSTGQPIFTVFGSSAWVENGFWHDNYLSGLRTSVSQNLKVVESRFNTAITFPISDTVYIEPLTDLTRFGLRLKPKF